MPLTDVAVRNARAAEKTTRLFDAGGLYLELSPAGGKWWRLKYRHLGKEAAVTGHLSGDWIARSPRAP